MVSACLKYMCCELGMTSCYVISNVEGISSVGPWVQTSLTSVCAPASPRGALQRPAGNRREESGGGRRERGGRGEGRYARWGARSVHLGIGTDLPSQTSRWIFFPSTRQCRASGTAAPTAEPGPQLETARDHRMLHKLWER